MRMKLPGHVSAVSVEGLQFAADENGFIDVPADATMPVGTDAYITQTMMIEMITILLGRLRGPNCVKRLEQIHKMLKAKDQDTDESSVVHWGWKAP